MRRMSIQGQRILGPEGMPFRLPDVEADLAVAGWLEVGQHRMWSTTGLLEVFTIFEVTEAILSGGALTMDIGVTGSLKIMGDGIPKASLTLNKLVEPRGSTVMSDAIAVQSVYDGTRTLRMRLLLSRAVTGIGYTINAAASNDGKLRGRLWYAKRSDDATIVAAAGGSPI